jgi:hypothetical protein
MLPGNRSSGCCAPAGVSAPGTPTGPLSTTRRMRSGGTRARTGKPQSKTLRLSQSNLPAPRNELRPFRPNNFLHESLIVGYTSIIIPPSLFLSVKLDCIDGNLLALLRLLFHEHCTAGCASVCRLSHITRHEPETGFWDIERGPPDRSGTTVDGNERSKS